MQRRTLVAFVIGFLLTCTSQQAPAQFLGYTSPQTVQQQIFNNIAAPAVSPVVQNIGQTVHIVAYAASGATAVEVVIEADPGSGAWIEISNTSTSLSSGILYASGYYPRVRGRIKTLTSFPPAAMALSAWYAGTSTTVGPEAGLFRFSGTDVALVRYRQDATVQLLGMSPSAPLRSSEGTLFFIPDVVTGVTPATGAFLSVRSSNSPNVCGGVEVARLGPLTGGSTTQMFRIPAAAAAQLCIDYRFNAAPTGGTYSIYYAFGPTAPPQGVDYTWPALAAAGVTGGLNVKYADVEKHSISLAVTGAPAACTFQLEGSLDSTNGVDGNWFALSGAVDCTVVANRMFHVVNKPVVWVRGNTTALSAGATVTPAYVGVH